LKEVCFMENKSNGRKINNFLIRLMFILLIIILVLIIRYKESIYKISGSSMYPTLVDGQIVLASPVDNYKRGDLIAFHHKDNIMIKRIIGEPEDTINIDEDGNVYINGNLLEEEYLDSKVSGGIEVEMPLTLGDDEYFVMGDNRGNSLDSRMIQIGNIKRTDIIGKITLSLYPYEKVE